MANKIYEENDIRDIAKAIREKNGTQNTYLVSEMADAVREIKTGITADTISGWHFAVRDDGTPPTSVAANTLTFVYNKNGG